jgi:hypothetical protein
MCGEQISEEGFALVGKCDEERTKKYVKASPKSMFYPLWCSETLGIQHLQAEQAINLTRLR